MKLDDYGRFEGGVFYFWQPFPFISPEGVTLLAHLDYRRLNRVGISPERLVLRVLEDQIGVPDPLRQGKPHQEAPKADPGE